METSETTKAPLGELLVSREELADQAIQALTTAALLCRAAQLPLHNCSGVLKAVYEAQPVRWLPLLEQALFQAEMEGELEAASRTTQRLLRERSARDCAIHSTPPREQ